MFRAAPQGLMRQIRFLCSDDHSVAQAFKNFQAANEERLQLY